MPDLEESFAPLRPAGWPASEQGLGDDFEDAPVAATRNWPLLAPERIRQMSGAVGNDNVTELLPSSLCQGVAWTNTLSIRPVLLLTLNRRSYENE